MQALGIATSREFTRCLSVISIVILSGCSTLELRTQTYFYSNGQEQVRFETLNGKQTGRFVRWYENGSKESECDEISTEPYRTCRFWFPDGTLFRETEYNHREVTGIEREWFANGQFRYEGNTSNKLLDGQWLYWSRDGESQWTVTYRSGRFIGVTPAVEECPQDAPIEARLRKRNRHTLSNVWCHQQG